MRHWGFILFILLPLLEIMGFVWIGGAIGVGWTLFIILLSGLIGLHIMRGQGGAVVARLRAQIAAASPIEDIVHVALNLMAGLMLLAPGFFTDMFGLLLLWPPFRMVILHFAAAQLAAMMPPKADKAHKKGTKTIESEYSVRDDHHRP